MKKVKIREREREREREQHTHKGKQTKSIEQTSVISTNPLHNTIKYQIGGLAIIISTRRKEKPIKLYTFINTTYAKSKFLENKNRQINQKG